MHPRARKKIGVIYNDLYGLECFSVAKADIKSLDFAVTRFLMKLFRTTNIYVVEECKIVFLLLVTQ